jgi:ribosome-associated heat shock protein Hsp15
MRLDIWLSTVLLFKTRSSASNTIKDGDVLINGNPTKSAHLVNVGDKIEIKFLKIRKVVIVKAIPSGKSIPRKDRLDYYDLILEESLY